MLACTVRLWTECVDKESFKKNIPDISRRDGLQRGCVYETHKCVCMGVHGCEVTICVLVVLGCECARKDIWCEETAEERKSRRNEVK